MQNAWYILRAQQMVGNSSVPRPPFNLRWKGLIISHQAKSTETCFWEKFLCVNSEVNSTRAPRVASKGSLLWTVAKPERGVRGENHLNHQRSLGLEKCNGRRGGEVHPFKPEDHQVLLLSVKGKFLSFEISKQSETLGESLITSSKKIKPVNLKGNQPWILAGRTDAKAEAPGFCSSDVNCRLIGKSPWWWERLRAEGEEGVRGGDGWMPSCPMWWTWTWANFER